MAATFIPKNVLITGAAGFIGSHVANLFAEKYPEYNVIVLDKLDYCGNLKNLNPSQSSPNFKFIEADICDSKFITQILTTEKIDTILHFAAHTHVDNSFGDSLKFTKNNIEGTHILLECCRKLGSGQITRFVHVSTDEVYGETEKNATEGTKEDSPLLPTNPYAATKAGAEMLVMSYHKSYGLPTIVTRGNNVYGPKQFPEKLIPKFLLLAMAPGKVEFPIHGDGSNLRSYLYCDDVAEAFDCIVHKGRIGEIYNIGTQKEKKVVDVARDICHVFSLEPHKTIQFVVNRPFNDQRYFVDDSKLKNLGWVEKTDWADGLRKTVDWYRNNAGWWGDVSEALKALPLMARVGEKKRKFG